jgi:hypothetical protein
VSGNPRDAEAKQELEGYKRSLAKRVVHLRVDANNLGLDQPCLKLLDTIEKNARFNKKLNKKLLWDAKRYREEVPYDREEWLTEEVATT